MNRNKRGSLAVYIFSVAALLKASIMEDMVGMILGGLAMAMVGLSFVFIEPEDEDLE